MVDGIRKVIEDMIGHYRKAGTLADLAFREYDLEVGRERQGEQGALPDHVDALCNLIGADRPDWSTVDDGISDRDYSAW